jgi:exosortase A
MTQLSDDVGQSASEPAKAWRRSLILIGALIAGIGGLYWTTLAPAVRVWIVSPTFTHCFLVIPTAAYLIWLKRDELRGWRPVLEWRALPLVLPLSALWLFGRLIGILEIQQVAVIGIAQTVFVTALGWRLYRVVMFPALFLFFLVPTGEYLVGPLQRFTTAFVAEGLDLLGIPAFVEGTLIELANGNFQVAEACAGLRFLIATIVIGVLFAHLFYTRPIKRVAFLLACCVVPVIGNGLRALGIVVLAHLTDNRVAAGADHIVYGWGFSVVILFVLLYVGSRFSDTPPFPSVPATGAISPAPSAQALLATVAAGLLLASVGPLLAWQHENRPVYTNASALVLPAQLGPFAVSAAVANWRPLFLEPDQRLAARLTPIGADQAVPPPVDLDLFYYGRMRKTHELVSSSNRLWDEDGSWRQTGQGQGTTIIAGTPIEVSTSVLSSVEGKRLVWSWYWMDHRFTISKLVLKLLQLKTTFATCEGGAFVALSTPIDSTMPAAAQRLSEAARALAELPGRLSDACAGQEPGPR